MQRNRNIKYAIDWWTILLYFVLVGFGWMNIYGASYEFDQGNILDFSHRAGKQFIWILTALGLGGIIALIDSKAYNILAYIVYGAILCLLIITPILAEDIKGSKSWLSFGPISLQPAELAKVATALALARYMSQYGFKIKHLKDVIVPLLIIGIPFLIIMIPQKETGSALVFGAFLLVLYREGLNGIFLLLGLVAIAFFIIVVRLGTYPIPIGTGSLGLIISMILIVLTQITLLYFKEQKKKPALYLLLANVIAYVAAAGINFWISFDYSYFAIASVLASSIYLVVLTFFSKHKIIFPLVLFSLFSAGYCFSANYIFDNILQPHQQIRIKVLLGMEDDPMGAGYNVNQAKIAIGSGGFSGKGFLNGTQTKLKYVPEQDTDFIFCTVGEEWGFVGSAGLLIVYLAFLFRLIFLAERQRDTFSRIYGYSVLCIFFFHLFINIGMNIGLMPIIGIPLPFFSYGGSSLWSFSILLFIFLRLDAARLELLR